MRCCKHFCGCKPINACACNWQCPCCCIRRSIIFITLSGHVSGVDGAVSFRPIDYTINGASHQVLTNAEGRYTIVVSLGASVTITPQVGLGVTVEPTRYSLVATENRTNLDFHLMPITAE